MNKRVFLQPECNYNTLFRGCAVRVIFKVYVGQPLTCLIACSDLWSFQILQLRKRVGLDVFPFLSFNLSYNLSSMSYNWNSLKLIDSSIDCRKRIENGCAAPWCLTLLMGNRRTWTAPTAGPEADSGPADPFANPWSNVALTCSRATVPPPTPRNTPVNPLSFAEVTR